MRMVNEYVFLDLDINWNEELPTMQYTGISKVSHSLSGNELRSNFLQKPSRTVSFITTTMTRDEGLAMESMLREAQKINRAAFPSFFDRIPLKEVNLTGVKPKYNWGEIGSNVRNDGHNFVIIDYQVGKKFKKTPIVTAKNMNSPISFPQEIKFNSEDLPSSSLLSYSQTLKYFVLGGSNVNAALLQYSYLSVFDEVGNLFLKINISNINPFLQSVSAAFIEGDIIYAFGQTALNKKYMLRLDMSGNPIDYLLIDNNEIFYSPDNDTQMLPSGNILLGGYGWLITPRNQIIKLQTNSSGKYSYPLANGNILVGYRVFTQSGTLVMQFPFWNDETLPATDPNRNNLKRVVQLPNGDLLMVGSKYRTASGTQLDCVAGVWGINGTNKGMFPSSGVDAISQVPASMIVTDNDTVFIGSTANANGGSRSGFYSVSQRKLIHSITGDPRVRLALLTKYGYISSFGLQPPTHPDSYNAFTTDGQTVNYNNFQIDATGIEDVSNDAEMVPLMFGRILDFQSKVITGTIKHWMITFEEDVFAQAIVPKITQKQSFLIK